MTGDSGVSFGECGEGYCDADFSVRIAAQRFIIVVVRRILSSLIK